MTDGAFDEDRELCADGACVGVIGPGGRCNECGREAGVPERARSLDGGTDAPGEAAASGAESGGGGGDGGDAGGDEDLAARELCGDGACVGVIGPDGRCKVCGAART